MGLRQRLGDLFWPPEEALDTTPTLVAGPEPTPVVAASAPAPAVPASAPAPIPRPAPRPRVVASGMDEEARARRAAAYERAAGSCPVPIHPDDLPLPGGLRLLEDEFLVAATSRPVEGHQLTLTDQRLIYTRGEKVTAQMVVYLADICDVAFHDDGSLTVGTPSGRWERLPASGNNLAASRHGLLELIHHARARRAPLPGGLDELVELRDQGALGTGEYERRRAAATAAPRRRRQQRQVEVAGRATSRRDPVAAADDAALAAPAPPAEPPAQAEDEVR
jgi:hypothetical protein